MLYDFGKAAVTPPKEGFLDIVGAPKRMADLCSVTGAASKAVAKVWNRAGALGQPCAKS
jgi:hypothetical protein